MNATNTQIVAVQHRAVAAFTAAEMKTHVQRIQQVMKAVMKDKTHFGVVPGTPKPSLWKPGAEVLCATFRIAPSYRIDDLSDEDSIRYRVTCIGTHQLTSTILGEGMGECSSNEEKYKWRRTSNREFDTTDENRRRVKYGYNSEKREEYETRQVRTEPADLANTVLKMACKRAQVAMTLNVTAASDIFTQDMEDLSPEIRDSMTGEDTQSSQRGKPATREPKASNGTGKCTAPQAGLLQKRIDESGVPLNEFLAKFEIGEVSDLPFARVDEALKWMASANAS
jgi:hypothetical protein